MAPVTVHLRRLPPGTRFLLRSSAGGILTRGRVVGPGTAGGVAVVASNAFDHPRRPTPAEWSGRVLVERDG